MEHAPSVLTKEEINVNQASGPLGEPVKIGIKGALCPPGTVIIRRTRKEDLIWAREQSKAYHSKTVKSNGYHVSLIFHAKLLDLIHSNPNISFGILFLFISNLWLS